MNLPDNFIPPEIWEGKNYEKPKLDKPYEPSKQKIEWYVALANIDYKAKFWKDLSSEIKELLIQALNRKTEEERDEILDNVNDSVLYSDDIDNELRVYLTSFTKEQIKTERNTDIEKDITNAKQLKSSVAALNWEEKNYSDVLTRIKNLEFHEAGSEEQDQKFKNEIESILTSLENPQTLLSISQDLKSQDPQAYETFKASIIELSPSFRAKFITLEPKLKLALWTDNLTNSTITGKDITQTTPDGFTTSAKLNGSARTLSRSDSQFTLNSALEADTRVQAEADKAERELNAQTEPITQKLQNLEVIKKYLETAKIQNTDISEVKEQIKTASPDLYAELWLDNLNSIAEINSTIETQAEKLTKERDEIESKAKIYLDEITASHKQKVQEKQEIQKQVLNFLHAIWLDRIPQATLNIVIANLNANLVKYGLQRPINLENGSLGFDMDLWNRNISEQEKQKFIELYNKIPTWNKTYPVRLENWIILFFNSPENAKANIPANAMFDIWVFANKSLWTDAVFQAMINLSKEDAVKQ